MTARPSCTATPARPRFPPRPALVVVEKRWLALAAAEHAPQHVRERADGVLSSTPRVAAQLIACTRAVLSFPTTIEQAIHRDLLIKKQSRMRCNGSTTLVNLAQEDSDRGPIVEEGLRTSGD
jgi:hypothetical protein